MRVEDRLKLISQVVNRIADRRSHSQEWNAGLRQRSANESVPLAAIRPIV